MPSHLSVISALLLSSLATSGCMAHKPTKAPVNSKLKSNSRSGANASKPASGNPGTPAPIEAVIKSGAIAETDFKLAATLDNVTLSSASAPFFDIVSGRILIPTCPAGNAACVTPVIQVFDPTTLSVTHSRTPTAPFQGHAANFVGQVIGINPLSTVSTKKISQLENDVGTMTTPPDAASISGTAPISATVVEGFDVTPNGRHIMCSPFDFYCYIPEAAACDGKSPSVRAFDFSSGYEAYCSGYPATTRALGLTSNNEIIFSDSSGAPAKQLITFKNLINADVPPISVELSGTPGANDPFSFMDYTHQFLFAFTSYNNTNSWNVIQYDLKSIVGHVTLDFPMSGHGTFFSDLAGNIIEVRPATSEKGPSVYVLSSDIIFNLLNEPTVVP